MSFLFSLLLLLSPEPQSWVTGTPQLPAPVVAKPEDAVLRVSPDELRLLLERKDAVVVDVRGDVPYSLQHIRGAISMPLGLVAQRALELPQDKMIVTYCSCKLEETSLIAALEFEKTGFPRTAVLKGGYPAWEKAGFPVDLAPPDPDAAPMPPPGAVSIGETPPSPGRGRLMPPPQVTCDRNDLTVYPGRAISYSRVKGKTTLKIRTDFDTTETVTLKHPGTSDPSKRFLLNYQPFKAADWKKIESRQGVLRPGMRAHAWVCKGGETLIDWRPDDHGSAATP